MKPDREHETVVDLETLIEDITVDAADDDEKIWAFRQALEEHVVVPCDAFVVGEPVSVVAFDYNGNVRRGLVAKCRCGNGHEYSVSAVDVVLSPATRGDRYLAAYRRWLGVEPLPDAATAHSRRQQRTVASDLELSDPSDLIVLSIKETAARCRQLSNHRIITLRASGLWDVVPGEIVAVKPRKQWSYASHPYLSGDIVSARLDVPALGLVPLRLEERGVWDPNEEYWGEPGDPIEAWAKPIIARGPRQEFEMEQVLPGADPEDPESDPITESNELKDAGDRREARKLLMKLCEGDLRCLDAHSHLGNDVFDRSPDDAIRHYEVGLRIGELSLAGQFEGVLSWGHVDNRPFLRCLHGYGLCCWRLGRFDEAERTFDRLLWLNPSDNQGARFLVGAVRARMVWTAEPSRR